MSAPQVIMEPAMYQDWYKETGGSTEEFYRFLTTPSAQRDEFLARYPSDITMEGRAMIITYDGTRMQEVKPGI